MTNGRTSTSSVCREPLRACSARAPDCPFSHSTKRAAAPPVAKRKEGRPRHLSGVHPRPHSAGLGQRESATARGRDQRSLGRRHGRHPGARGFAARERERPREPERYGHGPDEVLDAPAQLVGREAVRCDRGRIDSGLLAPPRNPLVTRAFVVSVPAGYGVGRRSLHARDRARAALCHKPGRRRRSCPSRWHTMARQPRAGEPFSRTLHWPIRCSSRPP